MPAVAYERHCLRRGNNMRTEEGEPLRDSYGAEVWEYAKKLEDRVMELEGMLAELGKQNKELAELHKRTVDFFGDWLPKLDEWHRWMGCKGASG